MPPLALLLAAVTSAFGFGRPLAPRALAGMAMVFAGCLAVPLRSFSDFRPTLHFNRNFVFVLLVARGTTGYTLCDSHAQCIMRAAAASAPPSSSTAAASSAASTEPKAREPPAASGLLRRAGDSVRMGRMKRRFNVAGPCFPDRHYMLPALDRLPQVRPLVECGDYFVIHAPRQTGKTTALKALVREINAKDGMVALYCTLETLQNATDPARASETIRQLLLFNARETLPELFPEPEPREKWFVREDGPTPYAAEALAVRETLSSLSRRAGKPFVVFFDEADCLCGQVLISFLRQLRDGYVNRDMVPFPFSVALVGMLDVRDNQAQIRPDGESLGQISPFNIIAKDLMLRNFTEAEIADLFAQHAGETGQAFEPAALGKVWEFTRGQPWLVNALARECVEEIHDFDVSAPVTAADVETAKETIIRRRDTHVDSLMERLREPRVRGIVEPLVSGERSDLTYNDEDYRFVTDLGLLRVDRGALVPANPMYAEIIGRYLSRGEQDAMIRSVPETPWAKGDGLDMAGLMAAFQRFWRENSGADRDIMGYRESVPHIVLMAFLQRVTNGGGHISREMALGSGRLDLCVEYRGKRYAVEVKTAKNFAGEKSYAQLAGYLDSLGLAEGWMPVFDEDRAKPWDEKLFVRDEPFAGKTIHVVGL